MNRDELQDHISRVSDEQFTRSSGPGGQNVNKLNTRVTLRVPLTALPLSEQEVSQLRDRLGNRVNAEGELIIHASETRSRETNRVRALQRATDLIENALQVPQHRRPTRPGRAARERRLHEKRLIGRRKRDRSRPAED
ncbi:MAG: aminoacyl-tRNA hydrolase [Spirochaetaceae bacterium]|nr:MAG: aminoacyl-tRNA hydrolase [Spirochaetaceae bacterium]